LGKGLGQKRGKFQGGGEKGALFPIETALMRDGRDWSRGGKKKMWKKTVFRQQFWCQGRERGPRPVMGKGGGKKVGVGKGETVPGESKKGE